MEITIKQALINGIKAHRAGRIDEASNYYTAVLKAKPDHPDANHNMGVLCVSIGNVEEAIPFFKKALTSNPKIEQFWLSLLDALFKCHRLEELDTFLADAKKEYFSDGTFRKFEEGLKKFKNADVFPSSENIKNKNSSGTSTEPPQAVLQDLIKLHDNGHFQNLLKKLNPILKKFPKSSVLLNIKGSVYSAIEKHDFAIKSYKEALSIDPNTSGIHNNLGLSLIKIGKFSEAINSFKKAISLSPEDPTTYFNIGTIHIKLNEFNDAIPYFKEAIFRNKDYEDAYVNLGIALRVNGKINEAIENFKRALVLNSNNASAQNNLGIAYLDKNEQSNAISSFINAIKIKPDFTDAINNLGNAHQENGNVNTAIECYKKAILITPSYAAAHFNLGNANQKKGNINEAIKNYQKAISFKKDYADAYNNLGKVLQEIGSIDLAIEHYKTCANLNPEYAATAYSNIGTAKKEQGNLKEAIIHYEQSISINPSFGDAHRHLSIITDYKKETKHFKIMKTLYNESTLDDYNLCNLEFAMAKAYEDLGELNLAFSSYKNGNELRKKLLNYNINKDKWLFAVSQKTQPIFSCHSLKSQNEENGVRPIFIIGMPRSGTTLIEQIISSHTNVFGGGELEFISRFASNLMQSEKNINLESIQNIHDLYTDEVSKISNGKKYVTDKMPGNFLFVPLIVAALPDARIIHVTRSPKATCWSNFKQYFAQDGNGYSYDLQDLVEYYKMYRLLMELWEKKYPNQIINCHYDHLTENQEEETIKLLSAIGLTWEDTCLLPHKNIRRVKTASQQQVRKEVYKGSSRNWEKFELLLNGAFKDL